MRYTSVRLFFFALVGARLAAAQDPSEQVAQFSTSSKTTHPSWQVTPEMPNSNSAADEAAPPTESAHVVDPAEPHWGIVSPDIITRDINLITAKYKYAGDWLRGIGLSVPDFNLTGLSDDLGSLDKTVYGLMPLADHGRDLFYYGYVAFGTGHQSLNISVDTGSADLWVKVNCRTCTGAQLNPSRSRTYRSTGRPFQIQYGSGSAKGVLAQDSVTIGGLTVYDQIFGAVSSTSADFNNSPESGLIGMAFSSIATSGSPTWFERLLRSNSKVGPLFSVHMTRRQPAGSEVCLGCYDTRKVRSGIIWLPVVSKTYWTVTMSGAVVNGGIPITSGEIFAAIDTGTTLVYVPDAFAQQLYADIPGAQLTKNGYWAIPCSSVASTSISLLFGSTPFSINMVDFNLGRLSPSSPYCACAIMGLGDSFPDNLAIVGVAFLKSWYSTYDYSNGGRVGLSRSVN